MSGGCKSTDALGIFCIIRVRIICSNLTHVYSLKNWSIYYNDLNFKSKSNYKFWWSEMGEKLQIGEIIQIMMKTLLLPNSI